MKVIYKCKVCGQKQMIPLEELSGSVFGQYEYECLENGEFLPIKAGVAHEIPVVPPQILSKCNEHYGLMDCIGFYEEPKEESSRNTYVVLSEAGTRFVGFKKWFGLFKLSQKSSRSRAQHSEIEATYELTDVSYVAEITFTGRFIPHNSEVIYKITGVIEAHSEFLDDNEAIKWFLNIWGCKKC